MKRLIFVFLLTTCAIFISSVSCAREKVTVFVSVVPQKYFVQQIGKDLVDAQVMVRPGASPATYEPKPSQMAKLAKSEVYFAIGVPFESRWLERIAGVNPEMKMVETDKGIEKLAMASHHHHHDEEGHGHGDTHENEDEHGEHKGHNGNESHDDHKGHGGHTAHKERDTDHGDQHEDDHSGLDPHIWLSPSLVKKQVATMVETLQMVMPEHAEELQKNGDEFLKEVAKLDEALRAKFMESSGKEFMVFHPSWGYFAREYGLIQVPIELEGKDPKPAELKELIARAKEKKITAIFVQPQFSQKSAQVIAREIGAQVVVADPLAENWPANLLQVAEQFQQNVK